MGHIKSNCQSFKEKREKEATAYHKNKEATQHSEMAGRETIEEWNVSTAVAGFYFNTLGERD